MDRVRQGLDKNHESMQWKRAPSWSPCCAGISGIPLDPFASGSSRQEIESVATGYSPIGQAAINAALGLALWRPSRSSANPNSGMKISVQKMMPALPGTKLCAVTICADPEADGGIARRSRIRTAS